MQVSNYNQQPDPGAPPPFDYRDLVNAMVNNGQMVLPPQAVERLGIIAGYDPTFNLGKTDQNGTAQSPSYSFTSAENNNNASLDSIPYPAVSVFLSGDSYAIHGCRYDKSYKPHMGEAVRCLVYGTEVFVVGAAAGNVTNTVTGTKVNPDGSTSPITTAVPIGGVVSNEGKNVGNVNFVFNSSRLQSSPSTTILPASLITQMLPNRHYSISVNVVYSITWLPVGTISTYVYFALIGPKGDIPLNKNTYTTMPNSTYPEVFNATVSTWDSPKGVLKTTEWESKYPHNQFTWQVKMVAHCDGLYGPLGPPEITFTAGSSPNFTINITDNGNVS